MKGFLRRTFESARGAEQRLKPLTGSVYAGNRRRQEFQPGSWGEETVNAAAGEDAAPPSIQLSQPGISPAASISTPSTLLPVTPEPRQSAASAHERNSERQRPSSATESSVASSAAPADRERVTRHSSHSGAFEMPVPLLPPLRPGSVPFSNSQRDEGSRAETSVPQALQNSGAEKNQQQEGPRPAPSAVPPKVEPLLRAAMTARPPSAGPQISINRPPQEPEIQIHIGRIEVIAAAPQPPRVPTPRPNRATSLADYLAGRNGRS